MNNVRPRRIFRIKSKILISQTANLDLEREDNLSKATEWVCDKLMLNFVSWPCSSCSWGSLDRPQSRFLAQSDSYSDHEAPSLASEPNVQPETSKFPGPWLHGCAGFQAASVRSASSPAQCHPSSPGPPWFCLCQESHKIFFKQICQLPPALSPHSPR